MNPFVDEQEIPLSPWWRYSILIVVLFSFTILGSITKLAYDNAPPIPQKTINPSGEILFTNNDITNGQALFLRYNLMEHGTLWGHGAYLGPDYSAAYLHEEGVTVTENLASNQYGKQIQDLSVEEMAQVHNETAALLKVNRYDAKTGTLTFTSEQTLAYKKALNFWENYFKAGPAPGLPQNYIIDPEEIRELVSFFAWSSWACVALRPGEAFTYTNNFPYDPLVGNLPSADAYLWSAISLIFLLGAIGLMLFLFGKFNFLGWDSSAKPRHIHKMHLSPIQLLPSQKALLPFFLIVALLFLGQALTGGGIAHYRVESSFYGIPLAQFFPYNLLRTWHLQTAIFWIATAWVGSGLFIAPFISGQTSESRFQKWGVWGLFVALGIVIFGSLISEFLSFIGFFPKDLWFWFGNQGSEYLDLGRFWQYLLIVGFLFWVYLLYRSIKQGFRNPKTKEMSTLFFLSALAIPLFYIPAVFYDQHTHFTIIDNWRFWIIHLWVEGFFEVFATVMTACILVFIGVTRPVVAKRVIYLDILLYLGAGVIGTGHHWYFTGQTTVNMALSACFSAMEVVPLTLLTLDAWDFIRVSNSKCTQCGHYFADRQKWTLYFLMSVGVWNFVGAGIFGFLINLPIISYFEVGTVLTPNHGHAALFGVFGMLALALTLFCLRNFQTEDIWKKVRPYIKLGFWGLNGGMALMILVDLFPAGIVQLWDVMQNGYWHARTPEFLMSGLFHTLEWARVIPDLLFMTLGVIPMVIAIMKTIVAGRKNVFGLKSIK